MSTFRINDIEFIVPATDINIIYSGEARSAFILRTKNVSKQKAGTGSIDINCRVVILAQDILKLHRLLLQFYKMPFWEIENAYIKSSVDPDGEFDSLAVAARSLNVQSIPDLPNTLQVDLLLSTFNYKPYSVDFAFKKDLLFNGVTIWDTKVTGSQPRSVNIEKLVSSNDLRVVGSRDSIDKRTILEVISEQSQLLQTDLTPSVLPHAPTLAVSAQNSNLYKYYFDYLQAKAIEKTYGTLDLVKTVQDNYGKDVLSPNINCFVPHVTFEWFQYSLVKPGSALQKLINSLLPKESGNTDLLIDTLNAAEKNGQGTITSKQTNRDYKDVGTVMSVTDGIGRVTSHLGHRSITNGSSEHKGVDIGWGNTTYSGQSIPIHTTIKGTIYHKGWSSSAGNFVVVKGTDEHDGLWARHLHLASFGVGSIPNTKPGTIVGYAGTTRNDIGESNQVHAHYELWEGGCPTSYGGPGGGTLLDPENINVNPQTDYNNFHQELAKASANVKAKDDKDPIPQTELFDAFNEFDSWYKDGWRLYRSPHVAPTLYKRFTLTVKSQTDSSIPSDLVCTGWAVELFNSIASIPICGQSIPTAQFMGGSDSRMNFQFISNQIEGNLDDISTRAKALVHMVETLEYNNRAFHFIPDSWTARVRATGPSLIGQDNWIVSSWSTNSIPNSPGAYIFNLQLDASNKFEAKLKQGGYDVDEVYKEIWKILNPFITIIKNNARTTENLGVLVTDVIEVNAVPLTQQIELTKNNVKHPLYRTGSTRTYIDKVGKDNYFGIDYFTTISRPGKIDQAKEALKSLSTTSDDSSWTGSLFPTISSSQEIINDNNEDYLVKLADDFSNLLTLSSHSLSDKFWGGLTDQEIKSSVDLWGIEQNLLPVFEDGNISFNDKRWVWSDSPLKETWSVLTKNKTSSLATNIATLGLTVPGDLVDRGSSLGNEDFFFGKEKAVPTTQTSPGTAQLVDTTTPDLEKAILKELRNIFSAWFIEAIINNPQAAEDIRFKSVFEKIRLSTFHNMNACYPDLELPELPGLGDNKLTPVDFLFFNSSEDSETDVKFEDTTKFGDQVNALVKQSFTSLQEVITNTKGSTPAAKTGPKNFDGNEHYKSKAFEKMPPELKEWADAEKQFIDAKTGRLPISNFTTTTAEEHVLDHRFSVDDVSILARDAGKQIMDTPRYLMRRAFPTFSLFFLDEEEEENGWLSFSDFYNYGAIKTITHTRSRKIPADLLIVELKNINGILDGTLIGAVKDTDYAYRDYKHGSMTRESSVIEELSNKDKAGGAGQDHYFNSVILREGMNVQFRLGYSNNPNQLETVFNGRVIQVDWTNNNDEVMITCQSFAAELVQVEKGISAREMEGTDVLDNPTLSYNVGYADTAELLSSMLKSPEVLHFGRWTVGKTFQHGEASTPEQAGTLSTDRIIKESKVNAYVNARVNELFAETYTSDLPQDKNQTDALFEKHLFFGKDANELGPLDGIAQRYLKRTREAANNPVDDNIFVPDISDYTKSDSQVKQGNSVPLNHPVLTTAAGAVLAGVTGGATGLAAGILTGIRKETDPSGQANPEDMKYYPINSTIWEIFEEMTLRHPGWVFSPVPYGRRMTMFFGVPSQRYWSKEVTSGFAQRMRTLRDLIKGYDAAGRMEVDAGLAAIIREYQDGLLSRFKPFRNYFLATSQHDIVQNNISVSGYGVFNAVSVLYNDSFFDPDDDDREDKAEGKGMSARETLEVKAHDGIAPEDVTMETVEYFNCNGKPSAIRYATGSLCNSLKDIYKGSITLLGNPHIKPYDIVIIADEYNGITGPIEVEEVTHIMSQETGFISVIVPDAVVVANEISSWSVLQAAHAIGSLYKLDKLMRSPWKPKPMNRSEISIASVSSALGGGFTFGAYSGNDQVDNSGLLQAKSVLDLGWETITSPSVAHSLFSIYNYWLHLQENVAVNLIPLQKNGSPMVASIPEGLVDSLMVNLKGKATRILNDSLKGRLESMMKARTYGYKMLYSYDGELKNIDINNIANEKGYVNE